MTARTGNAFVPTTEATRWIVYFAYLGEEGTDHDLAARRLSFMEAQLRWLADLIRAADRPIEVLVPYVAPRSWDGEIHRAVSRHGFRIDPASVQADRRNTFEYHGFRAMQTLAEAVPAGDLVLLPQQGHRAPRTGQDGAVPAAHARRAERRPARWQPTPRSPGRGCSPIGSDGAGTISSGSRRATWPAWRWRSPPTAGILRR